VADKPAHLYRSGAALADVSGGRLHAVFVDRVILDLDGKLETLRLPHHDLIAGGPPRAPDGGATEVAQNEAPPRVETDPDVITPAQGWFANLNVERTLLGESAGLVLHPGKGFQRQYGLKDSDVLTEVNGVEVTDSDALAGILRTTAKSLSLTYVRDGVPRTVKLPMTD
jgi:type II secretory pathway component PulC